MKKAFMFKVIKGVALILFLFSFSLGQTINSQVTLNLQAGETTTIDLAQFYEESAYFIDWPPEIQDSAQVNPFQLIGNWEDSSGGLGYNNCYPGDPNTQFCFNLRFSKQTETDYLIFVDYFQLSTVTSQNQQNPATLLDSVEIASSNDSPFPSKVTICSQYKAFISYFTKSGYSVFLLTYTPNQSSDNGNQGNLSGIPLKANAIIQDGAVGVQGPKSQQMYVLQKNGQLFQILSYNYLLGRLEILSSIAADSQSNIQSSDVIDGYCFSYSNVSATLTLLSVDFSSEKLITSELFLPQLQGIQITFIYAQRVDESIMIAMTSFNGNQITSYSVNPTTFALQLNVWKSVQQNLSTQLQRIINLGPFLLTNVQFLSVDLMISRQSPSYAVLADLKNERQIYFSSLTTSNNPTDYLLSYQQVSSNQVIFIFIQNSDQTYYQQSINVFRPAVILSGQNYPALVFSFRAIQTGITYQTTVNVVPYTLSQSPLINTGGTSNLFLQLASLPSTGQNFVIGIGEYFQGQNINLKASASLASIMNLSVSANIFLPYVNLPQSLTQFMAYQTSTSLVSTILQISSTNQIQGIIPSMQIDGTIQFIFLTVNEQFNSQIYLIDDSGAFTLNENKLRIYLPFIQGNSLYLSYIDSTCSQAISFAADIQQNVLFIQCGPTISAYFYQNLQGTTLVTSPALIINNIQDIGIDATNINTSICIEGILFLTSNKYTSITAYDYITPRLIGVSIIPAPNQDLQIQQLVIFKESYFTIFQSGTSFTTSQYLYNFGSTASFLRQLDMSNIQNSPLSLSIIPLRKQYSKSNNSDLLIINSNLVFSVDLSTPTLSQLVSILPNNFQTQFNTLFLFGTPSIFCSLPQLPATQSQCFQLLETVSLIFTLNLSTSDFSSLYETLILIKIYQDDITQPLQQFNLILSRDTSVSLSQVNTQSSAINSLRTSIQDSPVNTFNVNYDDSSVVNGNLLGWESLGISNFCNIQNRLQGQEISQNSSVQYSTIYDGIFFILSASGMNISNLQTQAGNYLNCSPFVDENSITDQPTLVSLNLIVICSKISLISLSFSRTANQSMFSSVQIVSIDVYEPSYQFDPTIYANIISTSKLNYLLFNFDGSNQLSISFNQNPNTAYITSILQSGIPSPIIHYIPTLSTLLYFYKDGTITTTLPSKQQQVIDLKSVLTNSVPCFMSKSDQIDTIQHYSVNGFRISFHLSQVFDINFVINQDTSELEVAVINNFSYQDAFQTFIAGVSYNGNTLLAGISNNPLLVTIALFTNQSKNLIMSSFSFSTPQFTISSIAYNSNSQKFDLYFSNQKYYQLQINNQVALSFSLISSIQPTLSIQPIQSQNQNNILSFRLNYINNDDPIVTEGFRLKSIIVLLFMLLLL